MTFVSEFLGLSIDSLWLFAGVFLIVVGLRCLPLDLRKPGMGGIAGAPTDVALVGVGVLMIMGDP